MPETTKIYAETPALLDERLDPFAFQRDAFSDVLELIRLRGNTVFSCAATAPFAIHFPAGKHRIHIVRSGRLTIEVDGGEEIFHASRGDLVLILNGCGHVVSDRRGRKPKPLLSMAKTFDRAKLTLGSGDITWLCGDFVFDGAFAGRLLSVLPPVIVLKGLRDRPFEWLELSCHFILDEALNPRAGAAAMISRLLDVIFVQLLRTWSTENHLGHGWLSGAIDPRLSPVIATMHANLSHPWTVGELAELSNLSRSAFAGRFQRVVGQAPLRYLANWRLDRAAELLRYGKSNVSFVAAQVGYTSEASFTRAFKARYGAAPTAWRRATEYDGSGASA